MQQMTADVSTSSLMSVPIKTVLWAKVMVDDLVNFQLRPGSPNTLMATIKGTGGKMSGTDGTKKDESKHGKKQPQPPDATTALMEITSEVSNSSFQTIPVVSEKNHGPTQPVQLHQMQVPLHPLQ